VNDYRQSGDVKLSGGQLRQLGSDHGLESILHQLGLNVGKNPCCQVDAANAVDLRFRKLAPQRIEDISDQ
jgi:hypothetical protein